MKKLNKMLLREVQHSKGQFIAAVTVVILGISMFTAAFISYRNLKNSKDYYYSKYSFLDYYAVGRGFNSAVLEEVKSIEGVKESLGRISIDAGADMAASKRVTVRLLSLPDNEKPKINNLYMMNGIYENFDNDSCLISKSFADYYKLEVGDKVNININNKKVGFQIAGITQSPEFIYEIKSVASPIPNPEDFGIVYIKEARLHELIGKDDFYNEIHIIFKDQNKDNSSIIEEIEKVLKPYGFTIGIERKDQISNAMVSNEIEEMKEIAAMFPILFLSVAAMIIYIMLRRIISNQRLLIGVMKAMGYKNSRILLHYILYALLIAIIGAILGTTLGLGLGVLLTIMYNRIFTIPVMNIKFYPDLYLYGILISFLFCLLAGYNSAKRVLKIEPSEAMRNEIPKSGRRIFLERIKFIWNRISFGTKMSMRNVFRNRKRAIMTAFSTSLTIMFIIVAMFFMDSIDYILSQHFTVFQQQDYKLTYSKPEGNEIIENLNSIDGIQKSEPILELPMDVIKGNRKDEALIVGLKTNTSLYSFSDKDKKPTKIPKDGILLSESMAKRLSIKKGEAVTIAVYSNLKTEKVLRVAGIIKQYAGSNCYMNIEELQEITNFNDHINGTLLKIDNSKDEVVKKILLENKNISTIESRKKSFESFKALMEFMYVFFIVMIVFGSIMGFAIIFNTTVINIIERKRELASLKVLGYSRKEIVATVFKENIFLGILSLVPGLLIGRLLCNVFASQFSNEFFTFEIYIRFRTYIIAIVIMFAFIILAQFANRRNIVGLDMIEVLKDREG